jgi:cytochrome c-type biogenesis protein CcmE
LLCHSGGEGYAGRDFGDGVSKGLQIAIGALLVAGLLGSYGWSELREDGSFRYYQTLGEFQQTGGSGPSRVHGYVANGTIRRDLPGRAVHFEVQETPPHAGGEIGQTLVVRFDSLETPDLFKDGAEVVVEGELAGGATPVFHATKVLAKCPSKFRPEEAATASF